MKNLKLLCVATFLLLSASVANAQSGQCGENLIWSFNSSTGTLTIMGIGDMYDYTYNYPNFTVPWYNYRQNITSVRLPEGITHIGAYAFVACSGLSSVTIPEAVTTIGVGAFDSSGLTSVTIPNSVTTIGVDVFANCTGLTSITIPDSVIEIGYNAFGGCYNLTSVIIGNSVTTIGADAFANCTGLTSITIPDSVIEIGHNAFDGCSSLISLIIGNSVTSIGNEAFIRCPNLTTVTSHSLTPPIIIFHGSFPENFSPDTFSDGTLYVPAESLALYQGAVGWQYFFNIEAISTSSVNDFSADKPAVAGYYSIMGVKLDKEPENEVYIILYDDGKTEKVMR